MLISDQPVDTEATYTLEDLERLDFSGTPLAVLGYPVRHSVSPAMQNAAIAKLAREDGRFRDWAYYRFEVAPGDLSKALSAFHGKGFHGLNLTVPHKVDAMEMIADVSFEAKRIGAVNTLVREASSYRGYNTDGHGLKLGLKADLDVSLKDGFVLLLGAGGAARAAAVQCLLEGCARLCVANCSEDRLKELLNALSDLPGGERVGTFEWGRLPKDLPPVGLVVNTTSLGLKPDDASPIDVRRLPSGWKVYDTIYRPETTALLKEARGNGLSAANGLSMLAGQGARSLEIWSGRKIAVASMKAAACRALK